MLRKKNKNMEKKPMRRRAPVALALAFAMVFTLVLSDCVQPSVYGMGSALAATGVDRNGNKVYCGKTEHQHSEACYTTRRTLICGQEETGHHHTEECYTEQTTVICGQTEHAAHHHTEECYSDQRTLICGQTEHAAHHHTDACYIETRTQICDNTDPDHVHTEECYRIDRVRNCGLEETEGHTHTDDCYRTDRVRTCGLEETEGHTHTAECFLTERVLTCGKEEREGHIHSDACWKTERVLSCGLQEHTHTLECYSDRSAVETEVDWRASVSRAMVTGRWDRDLVAVARTQIGYNESSRNYIVRNGVKHGYTRYGDWIDNEESVVYGAWCASFVAFCIHYAGIRGVPLSSNCAAWVNKLIDAGMYYDYGEIEPRMGDLMFIYSGSEKDRQTRNAIHMGIVAEITDHSIVTIEGNVGPVSWREYEIGETDQILGFARLPDNPKYRSIEGSRGRITYSGVLPDGAQAIVRPLTSEEIKQCELPEGRVLFAFETQYLVDGKEVKPGVAVNVRIETGRLPEGALQIFHVRVNDKGKVVEKWPVEDLQFFDDGLSYTTFTLSRCVAVLTEPESAEAEA